VSSGRSEPSRRNRSGADGPPEQQLKRFLGNSSRKIDRASLLVDALDLSKAPSLPDAVLAHV
jgi:hypothetical protein